VPRTPAEVEEWQPQFESLREALRVKAEIFAEITGILLLLGEPNAETALEEYRQLTSQWYDKSVFGVGEAEAAKLTSLRKEIIKKREALMAVLASIYKHE